MSLFESNKLTGQSQTCFRGALRHHVYMFTRELH